MCVVGWQYTLACMVWDGRSILKQMPKLFVGNVCNVCNKKFALRTTD